MTTDNIVQMPTPLNVLADRIRAALTRVETSRVEWINATLELATTLKEARERFPSNERFSVWLAESGLDSDLIGHQGRAALINMAADLTLARIVLHETQRTSWRLIWEEEMQPRLTNAGKTEPESLLQPQTPLLDAPVVKIDEPPKEKPNPITRRQGRRRVGINTAYSNAPRAEELAALFDNKDGRGVLAKIWCGPGGKKVWKLLLTAVDAGLLISNSNTSDIPNLRVLFPLMPSRGYASQFNLLDFRQCERVRDVILPAMIACRDKLFANPEHTQQIVAAYLQEQRGQQQQAVVAEKRAVAVQRLPVAEQELVMFGQTVWPRIDNGQGEYDYDQVRAAIWTFRDYEAWNQIAKEEVGSFALRIRNSLRYLREYMYRTDRNNPMNKIFALVIWFSHLMEKNPTAECKWPHYPHIEGQW